MNVLENPEEVEEQCAVTFRTVSQKKDNFESKFRIIVLKFATRGLLARLV